MYAHDLLKRGKIRSLLCVSQRYGLIMHADHRLPTAGLDSLCSDLPTSVLASQQGLHLTQIYAASLGHRDRLLVENVTNRQHLVFAVLT